MYQPNSNHSYLHHPLNRSPTKIAFSFSRTERFKTKECQCSRYDQTPCMMANGHQFRGSYYKGKGDHKNCDKMKRERISTMENSSKQETDFGIKQQIRQTLQRIKQKQDKYSPYSPSKHSKNPQNSRNSPSRHINTQYSPTKHKNNLRLSPSRQMSPIKQASPSKNMTASGYYPTGVQMSPRGKYTVSTIPQKITLSRNVVSAKMTSSSPRGYKKNEGPGYYSYFSEFGGTPHRY